MKTKNYEYGYHVIDADEKVIYRGSVSVALNKEDRDVIECMKNPSKDEDDAVFVDMVSDLLYPTMEEDYKKVNPEFDNSDLEIIPDILGY